MKQPMILVRGGGDLASAVACTLHKSGFRVVITEVEHPLVVRRTVSYAPAVIIGQTRVEGVIAQRAENLEEIFKILSRDRIPVLVDPQMTILTHLTPWAVIDATMAKKNRGMTPDLAPLTIALGPGFTAGRNVRAVIETKRGHTLGRIIYAGTAIPNTGIPEPVNGRGAERVLRAPCPGPITHHRDIGDQVSQGDPICSVGDTMVKAPFSGMLRGLIMANLTVQKGIKIGDIDPRCDRAFCFSFSDKARTVAGGLLEAVMHHLNRHTPKAQTPITQYWRTHDRSCENPAHLSAS